MREPVKTAVRIRPLLHKYEKKTPLCATVQRKEQTVAIQNPHNKVKKTFAFDYCLDSSIDPKAPGYASQDVVWQTIGLSAVKDAFDGMNASIVTFGQTGTGKTHTMFSDDGLVNRIASELLRRGLKEDGEKFHLEFSMLEIYENVVVDLLAGTGKPLEVREAPMGPMYASGAINVDIRNRDHLQDVFSVGMKERAVRASVHNAVSARVHTFCILTVTRSGGARAVVTLVDLAGNERHLNMGASGDRLLESNMINKSLDSLDAFVNDKAGSRGDDDLDIADLYKGNPLTSLLKPALGGNGRAWWIATVSPGSLDYETTLSTLRFSDRLRQIFSVVTPNLNYLETFKKAMESRTEQLQKVLEDLKPSDGTAENKKAEILATIAEFPKRLEELQYPWNKRDLSANPDLKAKIQRNKSSQTGNQKYLTNIDIDTYLCKRVFHVLDKPKVTFGCDEHADVTLSGIAVEANHCSISVNGGGAEITCLGNARCFVSGKKVGSGENVQIKVGDTITLGTALMFQLCSGDPKSAKMKTWEDATQEIYGANVRGLSSNFKLLKKQTEKSKRRMKQVEVPLGLFEKDLLNTSVAVAEANAISETLHKHESFETVVLPGEAQHGRDLEIAINVTTREGGKKSLSTWTIDKFWMRTFMMKKLHNDYVSTKCNRNIRTLDKMYPQDKDPFHDPPPDMVVGKAMVYLNPLAYVCAVDSPISIIDMRGSNEGELLVSIKPEVYKTASDTTAIDTDDEGLEEEPRLEHFKDGRLKVHMSISGIRGLQGSKQKGVYAMFKWFTDPNARATPVSKEEVADPSLEFNEIFLENITPGLLDYCSNDVIEVTVFCRPPEGGIQTDDMQTLREGFISEEPPPTMMHSAYAQPKARNDADMFEQLQGPVLDGEVVTPRANNAEYESRMKEAYNERERLELKIRSLEAQLQRQKKTSLCSLL